MDFEKYPERARGFVQAAQNLAMREGHPQLAPGHILKVLLDDPEGLCAGLIDRAGGRSRDAHAAVEQWLAKQPKVSGSAAQPQATRELMRFFDTAEKTAQKAGDSYVTVERMLLALAVEKDSEAGRILAQAGANAQNLNNAINALRKGRTADNVTAENAYDALKKYARDLTEAARDGKLDPVIGRDEEIRRTIQVLSRRTKNNPVFIDEMHTLVGAGKADGALDASNLLKPALARGELHCVGATTLDEYRKHVEKDAALARRFQPVFVNEPSVEDTVSRLRMQVDSKPEELDNIDREIVRLKIEAEALKKETDAASKERLLRLEKELADLEEQSAAITARWQAEKNKLGRAAELKKKLDEARTGLANAQRSGDWAKAGELAYGIIPGLEKELAETEAAGDGEAAGMMEEAVTPDHVAQVVSRWTGIPVDRMLEGEREKLLKMEDALAQRVVGQREAVEAVSTAVRRARAGLQDPNPPIGPVLVP